MSTLEEVFVSDPWLESQFTQVELRKLKSKFNSARNESGTVKIKDLPPVLEKLKPFNEVASQDEITRMLGESYCSLAQELCFEAFLRVYLNIQCRASGKLGTSKTFKTTSSLVKSSTTTLPHSISETEKVSYVYHINNFLGQDNFLKDFLPLDPTTNALFDLAKDGVLLCKLINIAVPGTIDERAINTKKVLYPWERNENHILCLNSAKVIGCTVANIDTQDLAEGKPHVLLELISQIIKIKLLADVDIKKTPELAEIVEDSKEAEELMGLASEKVLLKWMNYQLKKSVYTKEVTNFSSDLKDAEAYAHLLNVLAPEHETTKTLEAKDPTERANLIIEQAEKLGCKTYVTSKDIVEGCTNLNLAFVAQIFHNRNGLEVDKAKSSFAKIMSDDESTSRKNQRYFRMWNNSLGVETHVNNVWEDVKNGSTLLSASVGQLRDSWKNTFSLCCGSDRFYQKL